jgi:catechol 2,3-dioxygenase-like lactoylglutathione lyase family enzyme
VISEIRFVTIGVADLERSALFYARAFGYQVLGGGEPAEPLRRAWKLPSGVAAAYRVLGLPETPTGRLRLLAVDAPGEPVWGSYERVHDLGHYALNVRVRDAGRGWDRLLDAGAEPKSPPHRWRVGEIVVRDSQCYDPDRVLLDVFEVERGAGDLGEQVAEASEVQTVALHVADARRSQAFYEGLGFSTFYDEVLAGLEDFLGLPPGTRIHNLNLRQSAGSVNGRIEIVQYLGLPGEPLGERARPPRRGLLSISLATDDLERARRQVRRLGGREDAPPVDAVLAPIDAVRLATFSGPDGESLEIYEQP